MKSNHYVGIKSHFARNEEKYPKICPTAAIKKRRDMGSGGSERQEILNQGAIARITSRSIREREKRIGLLADRLQPLRYKRRKGVKRRSAAIPRYKRVCRSAIKKQEKRCHYRSKRSRKLWSDQLKRIKRKSDPY